MKIVSQRPVTAVATTYRITRKPTPKNQNSGNTYLSEDEFSRLTPLDFLEIEVKNTDGTSKGVTTLDYVTLNNRKWWNVDTTCWVFKY